jgi:hypothetical protein
MFVSMRRASDNMVDHKFQVIMPDICAWCGIRQALTHRRVEWGILKYNITKFLNLPICRECLPVARLQSALMGIISSVVFWLATYLLLSESIIGPPAPNARNLPVFFRWAMSLSAGMLGWYLGNLLNNSKINISLLKIFVKIPPRYIELTTPGNLMSYENAFNQDIRFRFYVYGFDKEFQRLNPKLGLWQIPEAKKIDAAEILLLIGSLGGLLVELPAMAKLLSISILGTLIALGVKKTLSRFFSVSDTVSWMIYFVVAIALICWLSYLFLFKLS